MKIKIVLPILMAVSLSLSAQVESKDEQGLDPNYSASKENQKAEAEAMNGWWKESCKTQEQRMSWFNDAKFGCFIHWGVYSKAGGIWKDKKLYGYAAHLMRRERISVKEYTDSLIVSFDPFKFNADEWMRTAHEAGMRYFIITAKHHDGFAVFPSYTYPFDIRLTKMKCDPMKELLDAAHKYGIKFGFYYSHAFDWEHPDAPGNDWEYNNPGGDKILHGKEWWLNYPEFLPKAQQYVNEKCIPQLAELVNRYHPDILWFDTPHKLPLSENLRILKFLRKIAPDMVINGRLARSGNMQYADYINTGDRAAYFYPTKGAWESIPTTNESYAYNQNDHSHKSPTYFIRLLASAASRGGNILLNVGPKGDGSWDATDVKILKGIGDWMRPNGVSIYGTTRSGLPTQSWGETTCKGDSIFLHVFNYPKNGKLYLSGMDAQIVDTRFLVSGEKVKSKRISKTDWLLTLPPGITQCVDTVLVVQKSGIITPSSIRLLINNTVNVLLAFDATQSGDNFQHGDGKPLRNYLSNWTNPKGCLEWKVKNLQQASYNIVLEYTGTIDQEKGRMKLIVDGKEYPFAYADCNYDRSEQLKIATLTLKPGEHSIVLKGIEFSGKEFLRPLSLRIEERP